METEYKNHYELLGISRSATKKEIKQAYKEIALVYHPDSNFFDEIVGGAINEQQLSMFKQITQAYHTLMNDSSRAEYDQKLAPDLPKWQEQPSSEDLTGRRRSPELNTRNLKTSGTFATFGAVHDIPRSRILHPDDGDIPTAVSEVIFRRKKTILGRLLSLIGL